MAYFFTKCNGKKNWYFAVLKLQRKIRKAQFQYRNISVECDHMRLKSL